MGIRGGRLLAWWKYVVRVVVVVWICFVFCLLYSPGLFVAVLPCIVVVAHIIYIFGGVVWHYLLFATFLFSVLIIFVFGF